MSGHHNINVGLNVQFNADNTGALKELNATLETANKSQIEQNKQIDALLKAIGQSTKGTTTEIVKETRATRDATASMNAWAGSMVKVKSLMYQNIGTFRNLGEMAIKSITSLSPYTKIVDVFVQMTDKLGDFITRFKEFIALDSDFTPTIWEKLKPPANMITNVDTYIKHFKRELFGLGDITDLKLEDERSAELKQKLDDAIEKYRMAPTQMEQLEGRITETIGYLNEKYGELVGGGEEFLDQQEEENQVIRERIVLTRENAQAILQVKEANGELLESEAELLRDIRDYNTQLSYRGDAFKKHFRDWLEEYLKLQQVDTKGRGGRKKPKEEFKDYYGDISWFIEQWEESTLIKEKNWLTDLEKWRRDAYRRRDKDAKTQWEKWKSEWLIRETFLNKYIANAKKQREEVQKIQDDILTKYNGDEKQNEGAAYLESEARRRASLLTRDYLNVNLKKTSEFEKRQIANMEKDLTDSLKQASDQAWSTLQQKLKEYDKVIKQQDEILARPDLDTNQQYRAWTIQNMMRDKSKEAWKEYYDYLDERSYNLAEAEKKIADERAKQWSDQFRFINKDEEYWKGTKKAMDAVIEATNELGVSEKTVHAISNYAKGIEASVDALNMGADALKLFAVGDYKGAVAMGAAAAAKTAAAVAYFKNAIDLGGKGGSTPNVPSQNYTGTDNKDRNITINMAFEGTAGAVIGPLADAFNAQASVPGGVRLNSNIIRRR